MISLGQILGNYRIVRQLGEGGMGAVFEAVHKEIGNRAAIKVLHTQLSQRPQVTTRFLNEARAASVIQHPGIVTVFEFGHLEDGMTYLVMELLRGESLARRMERLGKEQAGDALRIARQIASALAAAHEKGIIHRDLKPDNVMIVDDPEAIAGERAKVLDFGIAKVAEEYQSHDVSLVRTQDGMLLGTPRYMSPEQCRGAKDVNDRSDVYSLGVILYQMLCGVPLFDGDSVGELIANHLYKEPPALPLLIPVITDGVVELVYAMLRKSPAERPSMAEVVARLRSLGALDTWPLEPGANDESRSHGKPATTLSGRARLNASQPPAAVIALRIVALMLVVVAIAFVILRPGKKRRAPVPDATVPTATPPSGMALIPRGIFQMGSTTDEITHTMAWCQTLTKSCARDIYEREQPLRTVAISSFFLDRTEVTNEAFATWLAAHSFTVVNDLKVMDGDLLLINLHPAHSAIAYARTTGRFSVRQGAARRPVVQVTWDGAQRYCADQGKVLPTEAQWEWAARGPSRTRFPWGNQELPCDGAVFARGAGEACATAGADLENVGHAARDRSPAGIYDLGGSVAEWVRDAFITPYLACDGCVDPVVNPGARHLPRVIRGGDWARPAESLRSAGRSRAPQDSVQYNVGFRCAKPIT